jgi:hypothetical protein
MQKINHLYFLDISIFHFFFKNFSLTELGMVRSTSKTLLINISITLSLFF